MPVPIIESFEALNQMLLWKAQAHLQRAESFAEDLSACLPFVDFRPCVLTEVKADKYALIRFDGCSYSVPTKFAMRSLLAKATPFKVEILNSKETVAVHSRCIEKGRIVTELAHYVDLLETKPRAVKTALPVLQAGLPEVFELFRRNVEDGTGTGDRRFVGALRLAGEYGVERVAQALESAIPLCVSDPADLRLLILQKAEEFPRRVCSDWKPSRLENIPRVELPPLSEYTRLLQGVSA